MNLVDWTVDTAKTAVGVAIEVPHWHNSTIKKLMFSSLSISSLHELTRLIGYLCG